MHPDEARAFCPPARQQQRQADKEKEILLTLTVHCMAQLRKERSSADAKHASSTLHLSVCAWCRRSAPSSCRRCRWPLQEHRKQEALSVACRSQDPQTLLLLLPALPAVPAASSSALRAHSPAAAQSPESTARPMSHTSWAMLR